VPGRPQFVIVVAGVRAPGTSKITHSNFLVYGGPT
jgi:hypothetical protein